MAAECDGLSLPIGGSVVSQFPHRHVEDPLARSNLSHRVRRDDLNAHRTESRRSSSFDSPVISDSVPGQPVVPPA